MRIEADRDVCIGAGMCVMTAASVFDQDAEDGRVLVLETEPPEELAELVREAARLCPSGALSVLE